MPVGMARWRMSGTFVNFLPVDVWRTVALMAGPEGSLAMWLMCFPSRAGLVAIGARIHHVRGYLIPRQQGVAFKEDYYPWDRTAMSHQAREERVQFIRSGKQKASPGWVEWTVGPSRYEPRNGLLVNRPPPTREGGLDWGDPWAIWVTGQSALVDKKVHGKTRRRRRPVRPGAWVGGSHYVRPLGSQGIYSRTVFQTPWEGGDWMLGFRGREAMGSWMMRDEEHDAKATE